MFQLERNGFSVPSDISLIGYDDSIYTNDIGLTTIRQNPLELGRAAARKTLQLLKDEPVDDPHEAQEPVLVLRDTTGRVARDEV